MFLYELFISLHHEYDKVGWLRTLITHQAGFSVDIGHRTYFISQG